MLAIVIPYFNLCFFDQTMLSLANQTDQRFKVYIGDDASPENPSELLNKFKNTFDFNYYRFDSNLGNNSLSKHWERCIGLTQDEEWIMVLGDDDMLGENVVEEFYNHYPFYKDKANLVRFASKIAFEPSKHFSDIYKHPIWEKPTDSYYRKFKGISRSSLSEYIFLRKSYERYKFYDYPLAWNSDDRAWLDFSENLPIYTINNSIIYVRRSSINITGKRDNLRLKDLSSVEFNKFLILNKFKDYSKFQRVKIVRKYHLELKRIKALNICDYIFIFKYYIGNMNLNALKGFIKKYIKL